MILLILCPYIWFCNFEFLSSYLFGKYIYLGNNVCKKYEYGKWIFQWTENIFWISKCFFFVVFSMLRFLWTIYPLVLFNQMLMNVSWISCWTKIFFILGNLYLAPGLESFFFLFSFLTISLVTNYKSKRFQFGDQKGEVIKRNALKTNSYLCVLA